ncbi:hypothetical protein P3553_23090 [Vibrio parahaemolyticus]|nr:hypothetical protein [Vibrio parahaemolyticus]EGQ8127139.1 hypothetical protein [Vibrio parahaemolyticus]EIN4363382.1 hypothetical protein [Vibrio parahaemolyticus]MDF4796949.1 hypothetical protein [Vibrio parahaemolyticus]MDF5408116.1 hypothetical protein [Vibrio parahaemolyticus]MDG2687283.1 hypothetical protein [Vibrio parahaemolyticus]
MKIKDIVEAIRSPTIMANYGCFYNHIFPHGKFVFSKQEKKNIRQFYEMIKRHPPSERFSYLVLGRLEVLIESLDFESAEKRIKQKNNYKSKKRSIKPPPTKLQQPSIQDIIESRKNLTSIGMGLDSVISLPKIKSEDVVIDAHTQRKSVEDKHILYAAGWSLRELKDDDKPTS